MNLIKDSSLITSISRVRARGGSSLNSLTLANRPTDQVKTQSARWFKATTHRKRGPKHCTLCLKGMQTALLVLLIAKQEIVNSHTHFKVLLPYDQITQLNSPFLPLITNIICLYSTNNILYFIDILLNYIGKIKIKYILGVLLI